MSKNLVTFPSVIFHENSFNDLELHAERRTERHGEAPCYEGVRGGK
jgi:hypothetical protein